MWQMRLAFYSHHKPKSFYSFFFTMSIRSAVQCDIMNRIHLCPFDVMNDDNDVMGNLHVRMQGISNVGMITLSFMKSKSSGGASGWLVSVRNLQYRTFSNVGTVPPSSVRMSEVIIIRRNKIARIGIF